MKAELLTPAILIGLLLTGLGVGSRAQPPDDCTCLWQGSFSEVAADTDLVTLGEVSKVRGNAVDLGIERVFQGETFVDTIRVWMQAEGYCRPEASRFAPDSRWILALNRITEVPEDGFNPLTPNISFGRKGDYVLSACGGYFLKANGGTAVGNLVSDMPRWDYAPEMAPVLIDLIADFVEGRIGVEALARASEEDPAARELMLDTRSFLRGQDQWLESEEPSPSEADDEAAAGN